MNCIVGLVHKYYGDALIRDIFSAWEGDVRQPMLDDMAWLYLENAAYRLELPRRPVLEALRFAHADYFFAIQYKLSRQEWMAITWLVTSADHIPVVYHKYDIDCKTGEATDRKSVV